MSAAAPGGDAAQGGGWRWPAMVIGLLGLNMAVCAVTITAATTSRAPVEPDYYDKALRWDEHRGIAETPAPATAADADAGPPAEAGRSP